MLMLLLSVPLLFPLPAQNSISSPLANHQEPAEEEREENEVGIAALSVALLKSF